MAPREASSKELSMAVKKKKADKPDGSEASFEQALETLESIVRKLDSEDLPLEEALAEYERGLASLKQCRAILDAAERKLEILVGDKDGVARVEDFDPEDSETAKPRAGRRRTKPAGESPDTGSGDEPGHKDGFLF